MLNNDSHEVNGSAFEARRASLSHAAKRAAERADKMGVKKTTEPSAEIGECTKYFALATKFRGIMTAAQTCETEGAFKKVYADFRSVQSALDDLRSKKSALLESSEAPSSMNENRGQSDRRRSAGKKRGLSAPSEPVPATPMPAAATVDGDGTPAPTDGGAAAPASAPARKRRKTSKAPEFQEPFLKVVDEITGAIKNKPYGAMTEDEKGLLALKAVANKAANKVRPSPNPRSSAHPARRPPAHTPRLPGRRNTSSGRSTA